ncbi:MAG: hypothetical protein A3G87_01075 [Omnitrophica bacterium RIFCSPLOWO2_12_FULL_50_11]|nr:MAG: hypothetical protein A3G87_01075 [Omnitrophica bacterium RIFCSPLOWO2_12_FULL_50_11]
MGRGVVIRRPAGGQPPQKRGPGKARQTFPNLNHFLRLGLQLEREKRERGLLKEERFFTDKPK